MSNAETSPLLPAQKRDDVPPEETPLLSSDGATIRYDGERPDNDGASVRSRRSNASSAAYTKKSQRRWPSIIAIVILALVSMLILIVAFFVPSAVEEYTKEAAVLEPTNLSLESITTDGVRARIQANFRLDGSRVQNEHVRRVGRAATWIVGKLGTEETKVNVYLPEYDNILLGTAGVPPLVLNLRDGHNTAVDFIAELTPGDAEGIRTVANEWLEGRLDRLRVQGTADIAVKSGILPLGTHTVSESLVFEAGTLPQVPTYNITKVNFREVSVPGDDRMAMGAEVTIEAYNKYPVQLDIPELGFEILVPNCGASEPYILVADATTSDVAVRPQSDVLVEVHGLLSELPESLTHVCPDSGSSPLDLLLKQYMNGEEATFYVRGQRDGVSSVPHWMEEILSSVTVPVPFPGRSLDNLIRNFSLTDIHFTMPDSWAEPGDPDADPKVSGTIEVTVGLPSEMNFELNVTDVRARSDVMYGGRKLGELDVRQWQHANSTKTEATGGDGPVLKIVSRVEDAPLKITDDDVLSDVIQRLLGGDEHVFLNVKATVDVKVKTILGQLVLKDVPAEGKIPVKPLPMDTVGRLQPQVGAIRVLETTTEGVKLEALVNITNPTPYTAHIPSIGVHILCNGSVIGAATAKDLDISAGQNTNLLVGAEWNPSMGGDEGRQIGRDLLSQYLSGLNTSIDVRTYRESIPGQPLIGEALSKINLTVPTPHLSRPGTDEDLTFIHDVTFHIFSSTATFTLVSPFQYNTVYIDSVNATALYNHTEPLGVIDYDLPFAAPPGASQTPKLPVDWSLDSVGYQKLREALGGQLKLDAQAVVGIRIGQWRETVWYTGRGIGASVRI